MGLGADRAWGLKSLLLSADIYAEQLVGLYASTDWTGEVGIRQQVTPRLVFDLGAVRHFAGILLWPAAAANVVMGILLVRARRNTGAAVFSEETMR